MSKVNYRTYKLFENDNWDNTLEICEFPEDSPDIRIHMNGGLGMLAYEFDSKEQLQHIIDYLNLVLERWS